MDGLAKSTYIQAAAAIRLYPAPEELKLVGIPESTQWMAAPRT